MRHSDTYFIYAGTYKEQVYINRPNLTLIGESRQTTRFSSNTVHITNSLPASQAGSNDLSGTVRVSNFATGVSLYNCKSIDPLNPRSYFVNLLDSEHIQHLRQGIRSLMRSSKQNTQMIF
jgi:pectinesterase